MSNEVGMNQSFKNRKHGDDRHNIMLAVFVLLLAVAIILIADT